MKGRLLIVGLAVAACALVALSALRPGASSQQTSRTDPLARDTKADASDALLPRVRRTQVEPTPSRVVPPPARVAVGTSSASHTSATDAPPPADTSNKSKTQTKEKPLAREALELVGVDPMAEAFWLQAINSPDVSAHDRSDLIEDLNEEGFADPKHLTPDDLPLIVSRLALIEREAPFAMDETNAAAFAEAYKDLVNMYERTSANAAAASAAAEHQAASEAQQPTEPIPDAPAPVGQ